MCGILGVVATTPVNQLLYDGLQVLQHRGQDAAGIATAEGGRFHMHKGQGLVRDVFRTRHMRNLVGNWGIGHCRYPTAGSAYNAAEAQPFYVNSPFGLTLAHNGNLTNTEQLKQDMFLQDLRHVNTNSDSEVLLNVLAHELQLASTKYQVDAETIFKAVAGVHRRVRGAYAVVVMISGFGLLAFRDPYGIRPLVVGRNDTDQGPEYLVASESVALDTLGFKMLRDIEPGEAVLVDVHGRFTSRQCVDKITHAPCMFEYVYLARPDSLMDGVSVYGTRVKMGEFLADKVPVIDSGWDAVHTFIRIPAGIVLASTAFAKYPPYMMVIAGLIGGTLALTSHAGKSTNRLVINHSPEPVSNWTHSAWNDISGVGIAAMAPFFPIVTIGLVLVLFVVTVFIFFKALPLIRKTLSKTSKPKK